MQAIAAIMTSRVQTLLDEAKNLRPTHPVHFQELTDPRLLKAGAHAAATESPYGDTVVHVDPTRVTEYHLAHELMHVILHRSGWPQLYANRPDAQEYKLIADAIDNVLDHFIFHPRLIEMGVDVASFRQSHVDSFARWANRPDKGPGRVLDALLILDALLMGNPYRQRAVQFLKPGRWQSLKLAYRLENAVRPALGRTKTGVRKAMLQAIDAVEEWVKQEGATLELRVWTGISPMLTVRQLAEPASNVFSFDIEERAFHGQQTRLGVLRLKADRTRFRTMIPVDPAQAESAYMDCSEALASKSAQDFLLHINYHKAAIIDS